MDVRKFLLFFKIVKQQTFNLLEQIGGLKFSPGKPTSYTLFCFTLPIPHTRRKEKH